GIAPNHWQRKEPVATELFGIDVIENLGRQVRLRVLLVSEDDMLPEAHDLDFFVRVLAMPRDVGKDGPLADRIEEAGGDLFDEDWLAEHAADYIRKAVLERTVNADARPRFSSLHAVKKTWKQEDKLPQAVFLVDLAKASFGEHLVAGQRWDTAA